MKTTNLRQKVTLWIIAAVVMTSLVGFTSPATQVFAGDCTKVGCSGG